MIHKNLTPILMPSRGRLQSILLTAAILFSASSGFAQVRCEQIFGERRVNVDLSAPLITPEALLEIGASLRARATVINPKNTHIPELIPLVQQIVNQTRLSFDEKKQAKLFQSRKPMIETVLKEIELRIANKTVTYEWASVLPYRLGFLSKVEKSPYDEITSPGLDSSYFYFLRTYLTHENFMAAGEKILKFQKPESRKREPVLASVFRGLNAFPRDLYLPAFMDLSIPQINVLFANKIYAIGMIRKPFFGAMDGLNFNEFLFPLHDAAHANQAHKSGNVPIKLMDLIELESLHEISKTSGIQAELLNFAHFGIFHEGKEFIYVEGRSSNSLLEAISLMADLRVTPQVMAEAYPKEFLALSPAHQDAAIEQAERNYRKILEMIVEKNKVLIESELSRIRL